MADGVPVCSGHSEFRFSDEARLAGIGYIP